MLGTPEILGTLEILETPETIETHDIYDTPVIGTLNGTDSVTQ